MSSHNIKYVMAEGFEASNRIIIQTATLEISTRHNISVIDCDQIRAVSWRAFGGSEWFSVIISDGNPERALGDTRFAFDWHVIMYCGRCRLNRLYDTTTDTSISVIYNELIWLLP